VRAAAAAVRASAIEAHRGGCWAAARAAAVQAAAVRGVAKEAHREGCWATRRVAAEPGAAARGGGERGRLGLTRSCVAHGGTVVLTR